MNSSRRLTSPTGAPWISSAILLLAIAGQTSRASAQEKSLGGHIGFGFPLVTHDGGNVTTLGDSFQMSLPVGITVRGSGRLYFDLEFVPHIVDKPREITVTVNPGILWRLGHGWSAGCRVGFDINSSQFGPTPLVIKSWPIEHSFFTSYFVEAFIIEDLKPVAWFVYESLDGSGVKNYIPIFK